MNISKRNQRWKTLTNIVDPTPRFYNKNPRVPDFFVPKYYDPARSISPGKLKGIYNYLARNPAKVGGLIGTIAGTVISDALNNNFNAISSIPTRNVQKTNRQYKKRHRPKFCYPRNNQHRCC